MLRECNGPGNTTDSAVSVAVDPGGGTVFVTGASYGTTSDADYATGACRAASGAQAWAKGYSSRGGARISLAR